MINGMALHELSSGEGAPTLLLHGWMGCAADWDFLKPIFRKRPLYALDLPGHGDSLALSAEDQDFDGLVDDLAEVLLELDGPCNVVGYSLGGRLAMGLATGWPSRVNKLVLESANPGLVDEEERTHRLDFDERVAEKLRQGPMEEFLRAWYDQPLFKSLENHSEVLEALIARRKDQAAEPWAAALEVLSSANQPNYRSALMGVKFPVLAIAGALDAKYSTLTQALAKRCPQVEACLVEGCGHNVHLENPESYKQILETFLFSKEAV